MSKLGDGSRFKKVEESAAKDGASNPAAVAAAMGMKKYGKEKMEKWAKAGKRKHEMAKKISSKCSTCGKGHLNHANYVTRTGNVE